ncbi:MAG: hypothetical protein VB111_00890 [Clostridiaceae bacterium]|nr:hypothetical protein [Clostridiaceae bacterium]
MLMEVINDYKYNGHIIELQIGDTVQLGEKTDPYSQYPDWIKCTSVRTGKTGWVAAGILTANGDGTAIVQQTYTSEEMSVLHGDTVETVYELNGWYWCKRKSDFKEAWIDKNNLKPIK